jgi:poly-gamma-glutamate capsule biosynthesis protein CapA/YwtB (metallophosphatase superfamily)
MQPSAVREPVTVTLFLCGDVMTGGGIDQILPHPGEPNLYEPYMRSALGYVEIAEHATGRLARLALAPTQIRHFRANRARSEDARWIAELLSREGRAFATRIALQSEETLALRWGGDRSTPA